MQEHEVIALILSEKKYAGILGLMQKIVGLVFLSNVYALLYGKRRDPAINKHLDHLACQMRQRGLPCDFKNRRELYGFIKKIDRIIISQASPRMR